MSYFGLILLCCIGAGHLRPTLAGNLRPTLAGRSSEVCFQSVEAGPCEGYFPRWFYNSTTRRCETFTYGGCGGNQNRFETREKCENACGCDRCTLQPDSGRCRAYFPSYFFNVTSGSCERFIYGGCGGNDNRFRTAADCAANCSGNSSCPVKGQVYESCPSCQGTCDNPVVPCPLVCTGGGCVCPFGQLVDTEADPNRCVYPSQCPVNCSKVQCPEVNCAFGNAITPPGSCCPVCVCRNGDEVYLPGEGFKNDCNTCSCTSRGLAICTLIACPVTEAPSSPTKSCAIEGQEYTECGTACPLTCKAPDPVPCIRLCVPGCQCPNGTVLDEENNRCVVHNLCPIPPCDMCSFQPESGPCEALSYQYFWNINTRQCENFAYGGCGGNINRFPTLDMCGIKCACDNINCKKGSQCKMHEPTGRPYCEPSCDLDNGGCAANQTCSLRNRTCTSGRPCPPVVQCKPKCPIEGQVFTDCGTACPPVCNKQQPLFCTLQCVAECQCISGTVLDELQHKCVKANECTPCPPNCTHEFCSKKRNRKKLCSRPPPHSTPACPNQCRTTYCNACYYSKDSRSTPQQCNKKVCTNEGVTLNCLKQWARCVQRKNRKKNKCTGDCVAAENFRCYDYPCLRG